MGILKRKVVSQPSIFRGYVSFMDGKLAKFQIRDKWFDHLALWLGAST